MKKLISGRQTGKTTKLIQLSSKTGGTIITFNKDTARYASLKAKEMGLVIPDPVDINTLMSTTYQNSASGKMSNVIVDDADMVLKVMLEKFNVNSISAISMCNNDPSDELI